MRYLKRINESLNSKLLTKEETSVTSKELSEISQLSRY